MFGEPVAEPPAAPDADLPFTGGWMVYLAYEMAVAVAEADGVRARDLIASVVDSVPTQPRP